MDDENGPIPSKRQITGQALFSNLVTFVVGSLSFCILSLGFIWVCAIYTGVAYDILIGAFKAGRNLF